MHECNFLILLNQQGIHYDFDSGCIYNSENGTIVGGWTVTDYDRISSVYIRKHCPPPIAKFIRTLTLINNVSLDDWTTYTDEMPEGSVCTLNSSLKP